ncbi:MAG: hypothetical protein ACK49N_04710 [Verrucomicrobiota bacterium]
MRSYSYITKAMQRSIRDIETTGFQMSRIIPTNPMAGIRSEKFHADFIKQTQRGLLAFHILIDTDGNINTNP